MLSNIYKLLLHLQIEIEYEYELEAKEELSIGDITQFAGLGTSLLSFAFVSFSLEAIYSICYYC